MPRRVALALEQVEDLRLDRDIQRRRRLVGDQDLGVGGERDGDRDALAEPPAQLVRILPEAGGRIRNADLLEQGHRPSKGLLARQSEVARRSLRRSGGRWA